MKYALTLSAAALSAAGFAQAPTFEPLGTFATGLFDESAAEIVAYDAATQRAFFTNAEDNSVVALDLRDPTRPTEAFRLDLDGFGAGVNGVAVAKGRVAVAVEAEAVDAPGAVVLFDTDGTYRATLAAGFLPDALAFSPSGDYLAVANEGQPSDDYDVDPEGSVQIVDFTSGKGVSYQVDFREFIGREDELRARGIRVYGPGANAAQDLEPEYVTWGADDRTVYVTLQENNAVAIVDRTTKRVELVPLGYKDHDTETTGFDASNRDDDIEIFRRPTRGMYQPDAIVAYAAGDGATYLVTANEGDARDYDGFSEEVRVGDLDLDPTAFPNAASLQDDENLGRLRVTDQLGDTDGDGDFDELYSYGARSFSILAADGSLVYDSGDLLERTVANLLPEHFNANNDDNDSRKSRSDDKGPEPEAIAVGTYRGRSYALVGLERQSAVVVFDVTDPRAPTYVTFFDRRDFSADAETAEAGDLGPESIVWVDAADSPTDAPLVLVANEVSGTVTAYGVVAPEERFTLQLLHNNDGESELLPDEATGVGGIAAFAAVVDSLRYRGFLRGAPNLLLSSGDNFLPGPTFSAGLANETIYDALAVRKLGYDALAIGNHDFDFGPDVLARFVREATGGSPPPTFLSANLDFDGEPALAQLVDEGLIAASTVLYRGTQAFGVIGLTTPDLPFVSSPGAVAVTELLAEAVDAEVARLRARGIDKFILISHLQSIDEERELIGQLTDIDVAIAGGGDELLTNDPDDALPGTSVDGPYPLRVTDAAGREVVVVTTPGGYRYVGQLLVTFDAAGEVVAVGEESGPVLVETDRPKPDFVAEIERPVADYVADLDARVLATTEVELDGLRANVRSRETNQGNLLADALLYSARQLAADFGVDAPQVAFQNGGGIRNDGLIAAGSDLTELTSFDIAPFGNFVSVIEDVPAEQIAILLENAVSRVESGNGRFAQVAGLRVSYDPGATPQELDDSLRVVTPGERIVDVSLADGTPLIAAGVVVPGAPSVDVATINFLARGGDQYAFGGDFTNLGVTYQQALATYLTEGLAGVVTAAAYPAGGEGRITAVGGEGSTGVAARTSVASTPSDEPSVTSLRGLTTAPRLSPNPGSGQVHVAGSQAVAGERVIRVVSLAGSVVSESRLSAEPGAYRERVSLAGVRAGTYLVTVATPDDAWTQRLVVQ